jgi:hypothetical protein
MNEEQTGNDVVRKSNSFNEDEGVIEIEPLELEIYRD